MIKDRHVTVFLLYCKILSAYCPGPAERLDIFDSTGFFPSQPGNVARMGKEVTVNLMSFK